MDSRTVASDWWETRLGALVCFGAVLLARLSILWKFGGNFDSLAFRTAAELTLAGRNVYAGTPLYNYSPLWAGVLAGIWRAASFDFGRFVRLLGLLEILSDMGSALLLSQIARRLNRSSSDARLVALLFFANPISVVASSAHGQFDGLAIFFLLFAIRVALDEQSAFNQWLTAALLSLSILTKHVTVFQPLLFSRRVRRGGLPEPLVALPAALFIASFLPFLSAWRAIWRNVIVYATRGAQPGALQVFIDVPQRWRVGFAGLLVSAVVWAVWQGRHLELPRASLLVFLTTVTCLPSFGMQYLVWPLAVGSLYPSVGLGVFSAAGALFYSASPSSLQLQWPVRVSELGVWAAAALWLAMEVGLAKQLQKAPIR